jgi:hypothetical protein
MCLTWPLVVEVEQRTEAAAEALAVALRGRAAMRLVAAV